MRCNARLNAHLIYNGFMQSPHMLISMYIMHIVMTAPHWPPCSPLPLLLSPGQRSVLRSAVCAAEAGPAPHFPAADWLHAL